MVNELVERALRSVRIDDVMTHLARLTEHDRYQASLGIERAAEIVANAATTIGLADVTIERFTADGAQQWWTFLAPRAWTPTTATLEVRADGRTIIAVDHATQPFTIATYSAPAAGVVARIARLTDDDVAGAVVMMSGADFGRPDLFAMLAARGAVGFITDATSRGSSGEHVGRIELDLHTPLFGFSVTKSQREAIEAAVGAEAHVRVDVDRSARMPVVTGVLPGRGAGEVWLTSHLCHPRPGANDNASGSAALLGVASVLVDQQSRLDRSVRFVWGPEFLGVAALLHQRFARSGRDARPAAVINLDMVGEDPAQCGVPLVVERAPDWCASLTTPVAEHVVEQVFAQTNTHVGTWRPGQFLGFSDHALFANFVDPTWRSPAVQLWHPGDPFNHSAADTLDKVSPMQLRRATAAGAVLAEVFANGSGVELDSIVERWCEREEHAARETAERYIQIESGTWSRRLLEHVRKQNATMRALVEQGPTACRVPNSSSLRRAFIGRWQGPFNYRAVLAALEPARRAEVVALFGADKRNYAVLTHLAMLANGGVNIDEVADAASMALRAPIESSTAKVMWSALFDAGWIEETSDGR